MINKSLTNLITIAAVLLTIITGCETLQTQPDNNLSYQRLDQQVQHLGKIVDLNTKQQITPSALLDKLVATPIILLGEQHDNDAHHKIELWLAQSLAQKHKEMTVSLEMLSTDQQPKINKVKQWLAGNPVARTQHIADLIGWDFRWGVTQYGDLLAFLMKSSNPLLATNLSQMEIANSCQQPLQMTGKLSTAPQVRKVIAELISHSHGEALDDATVKCRLDIQQVRDRRMAVTVLNAKQPHLFIAGVNHIDKSIGVPLHIQDLAPQTKFVVVAMQRPGEYIEKNNADYVWYAE